MWILRKKMQLQKQKNIKGNVKKEEIIWKRKFVNPKWNEYERFFRSWKWINDNTWCREDPDGYRILRKANSWEIEWMLKWEQSWCFRKWIRKRKKMSVK